MRTALALGLIAGTMMLDSMAVSMDKQPEILAQFKRDELGSEDFRSKAENDLAQKKEALRDVDRMRNLPPHAIAAVANGVVSFDDLTFAEDGTLIDDGAIPATEPVSVASPAQTRHRGLRMSVAFSGGFFLLIAWFMKKKRAENPLPATDLQDIKRKLYSLDADREAGREERRR
jgi:hypothetical protein